MVQDGDTVTIYNGRQIGNHVWPIKTL